MIPILSVIVPVYNVERYLGECIDSIISQTFKNIEIIIVNDGSKDSSLEIAHRYERNDRRIRVISQFNQGLPAARNAGLQIARGEYVAFVDSDDIIDTAMYEKLITIIKSYQTDLVVCGYMRFDKINSTIGWQYSEDVIILNKENICEFFGYSIGSVCNKLYKNELIKKYKIEFVDKDIVSQEDYYFNIKYFMHSKVIASVKEPFYHYRIRSGSITNTAHPINMMEKNLRLIDLIQKYNRENSIHINIESFRFYLFNYLFSNAISLIGNHGLGRIKEVIKQARAHELFINAMRYKIRYTKGNFVRNTYNKFIAYLLLYKLDDLAAIIELLRVKRLNSKKSCQSYFE